MKISAKVSDFNNTTSRSDIFSLSDIPVSGSHVKVTLANKEEDLTPRCTVLYEIGKEYGGKCFDQILFRVDESSHAITKYILSAYISMKRPSHLLDSNPELYPFKKINLQIRNEKWIEIEVLSIPNQWDYISVQNVCYRCSYISYERGIVNVVANHDLTIEEVYKNCYH